MTIREYVSQRRWNLMGPVLPGGTVYTLVLSPNKEQRNPLLAGTPVGVFRSLSRGANWSAANRGLVGLQIATLASSSNGVLFLGSLDGTLARSVDGGYSWLCLPPLGDAGSITAIAVSPDYLSDGTILVGTERGGVFRSSDSGRSAKAANFGLSELNVLCLACAPGWPKKPVAFAGTVDGLFRSTNGGRAWRLCHGDLEGLPVQAVVVSPRFERDGLVYAATEEDGLFRSRDGGNTWEAIGYDIADRTINCLWISPKFAETRSLLAGTSSSGLYLSTDAGESWQQVLNSGNAVLALAGDDETQFAGHHNAGVYRSNDGGKSWEPSQDGLHANPLTQLLVASGGTLFAAGPDTGIYCSTDGYNWQPLASLPPLAGLSAFAVAPDYDRRPLLAVSDIEAGLFLSTDGGATWSETASEQVTALCMGIGAGSALHLFAGTGDGRLLHSTDAGATWQTIEAFGGAAVIRLEASPRFADDSILVAGTRDSADPSAPVSIWRSSDAGQNWKRLLQEEVSLAHLSFAMDPQRQGKLLIAMDRYLLAETEKGWQRAAVASEDPPVLTVAVRTNAGGSIYMAGTTLGVYISGDATTWRPMVRGMGYAPILALAPAVDGEAADLWALGLGGLIWKWESAEAEGQ